jgi:hypothetical protein
MTAASHPLIFWIVAALAVLFLAFFALGFVTIAQVVFLIAEQKAFIAGRDLGWSERWGHRNSIANRWLLAPEFAKYRWRLAIAGVGALISFLTVFLIVVLGRTPS